MTHIGSICSDSSTRVLQRSNTRSGVGVAALALALAGSAWPATAQAEEASQLPSSDAAPRKTSTHLHDVELLARAFYGTQHVGMLGVGVEGQYRALPHFGFGGAIDAFYVDNGADPYYSPNGTLDRGYHAIAFVEGDLFDGWITPYARLGLGLGNHRRFQHNTETPAQLDFVGELSGGLALRGGPIIGRIYAGPTLIGKDSPLVYGLALGARF